MNSSQLSHAHVDDMAWQKSDAAAWSDLRFKEVFDAATGSVREFMFGLAEINPGGQIPLHSHAQSETIYLLAGTAEIQLGRRRIELSGASGALFPSAAPHSIRSVGRVPLRYLYTYATEQKGQGLQVRLEDREKAGALDLINSAEDRWAVAEDFEQWEAIEPSKGQRGMRIHWMFGPRRRCSPDMMAGTCQLSAGAHYTLHYHDQAEIYFCLSGTGVVYAAGEKIETRPGTAIYVGPRTVHGADAHGVEPLTMYWLYGTEQTGDIFNWTPVEPVYTFAPLRT